MSQGVDVSFRKSHIDINISTDRTDPFAKPKRDKIRKSHRSVVVDVSRGVIGRYQIREINPVVFFTRALIPTRAVSVSVSVTIRFNVREKQMVTTNLRAVTFVPHGIVPGDIGIIPIPV